MTRAGTESPLIPSEGSTGFVYIAGTNERTPKILLGDLEHYNKKLWALQEGDEAAKAVPPQAPAETRESNSELFRHPRKVVIRPGGQVAQFVAERKKIVKKIRAVMLLSSLPCAKLLAFNFVHGSRIGRSRC
jgi:hypothetical protein